VADPARISFPPALDAVREAVAGRFPSTLRTAFLFLVVDLPRMLIRVYDHERTTPRGPLHHRLTPQTQTRDRKDTQHRTRTRHPLPDSPRIEEGSLGQAHASSMSATICSDIDPSFVADWPGRERVMECMNICLMAQTCMPLGTAQ
jgi:hypothetical protein